MSDLGIKLIARVQEERGQYERTTMEFNPSFAPTTPELLRLVDLYWIDRYKGGDVDSDGWKRAFYNIIENPTMVAAKQIDLDTKDVRIVAEEGQSYYPAWIFTRDLKVWLKKNNIGKLLNDFLFTLPKYGYIIAKKAAGNKIFNAHPSQIMFQPDVNELWHSPFITGTNEMGANQFEAMRDSWFNIDAAIAEAEEKPKKRVKVYDRFGKAPQLFSENYQIVTEGGVVLFLKNFDNVEDLYRMLKWDDIKGRLAGRGVVEKLFEAQINRNRVEEFKNKGLDWTSKIIFQTRDTTFARNLMTDVENGEVVTPQDPLTVVNNSEKNLPAYRDAEESWERNVRSRTFAFPEVAGERPPAGTPLGTTQATLAQAGTFYDMKREEAGLFFGAIIREWVIPEFKKERRVEHRLMLGEFDEEELTRIKSLIENSRSNKEIFSYITRNGQIPDQQTVDIIKATQRQLINKEKDLKIPARYYDNVEYKADVIITSEQVDVSAKLTTLQTVLNILGANPTIMNDPRTKRIFYRMLDYAGINPIDFQVDESEDVSTSVAGVVERGGSPPRTVPIQARGRVPQTV